MNILWLATRATAEISMVLLSAVTVLGILTAGNWGNRYFNRLVNSELHRRLSLLAVIFLGVHIVTSVVDTYVSIPWWSVVVPFTSPYDTGALAVGALAVDVLIAVIVTSVLRHHIGVRSWRSIHYLAYGAWALGMGHAVLAGTDQVLTIALSVVGLLAVAGAAIARLVFPAREPALVADQHQRATPLNDPRSDTNQTQPNRLERISS